MKCNPGRPLSLQPSYGGGLAQHKGCTEIGWRYTWFFWIAERDRNAVIRIKSKVMQLLGEM
jgi:hypothetical protein